MFDEAEEYLHSSQSGMSSWLSFEHPGDSDSTYSYHDMQNIVENAVAMQRTVNLWAKLSQGYLDPISPPKSGITVLLVQRLSESMVLALMCSGGLLRSQAIPTHEHTVRM